MIESTHSKSNMDRIKEAIAKLTLTVTQNTMTTKIDEFLQKMAHLETTQHSPTSYSANPHFVSLSPNPHCMKLDVPYFDGSDPLS